MFFLMALKLKWRGGWWAIIFEIIIARRKFSVLRLETLEFPFSSSLE